MSGPLPTPDSNALGRKAREVFISQAEGVMGPMADALRAKLIELVDQSASTKEMQDRRDAMLEFERLHKAWTEGTPKAWRRALVPPTATARVRLEAVSLELIGDDVVEKKILSSRLALSVLDKVTWELNDLRLRMQHLEGGDDLQSYDILRPEVSAQLLVEQWVAAGLARETWSLVKDLIQQHMVDQLVAAYSQTNEFLINSGVLPDIDLSKRVRRTSAPAPGSGRRPGGGAQSPAQPANPGADNEGGQGHTGQGGGYGGGGGYQGGGASGFAGSGPGGGYAGGGGGDGGYQGGGGYGGSGQAGPGGPSGYGSGGQAGPAGAGYSGGQGGGQHGGGYNGGGGQGGSPGYGNGGAGLAGSPGYGGVSSAGGGATQPGYGGGYGHSGQGAMPQGGGQGGSYGGGAGAAEETRMLTSSPPLARARARASGVIGQLKRLLTDRVAGFDMSHVTRPSPALAEALSQQGSTEVAEAGTVHEVMVFDDAGVAQVATALRQRTGELKKKAATSGEKATIEIVALMFQSILAEERIPPAVRVWFARLQMPVLRVALSEPEFFGTLQHPARQLIDRMGSCVMGFDASGTSGAALESEIKRVVQVIEQYPETGRRVFQLVYDEFQRFLSKFLTENGSTQRLVSVAQQVEQKETMSVQYTIEMRNMLQDIPVRDEIREFLFKVWADVLAVAAVKNGPQHEDTIALKKSASDLVWAASAKPNRNDRARVIQDLPNLLLRLRQGMTLMGVQGSAQEAHIKIIGDTLADAFLSKTEAIPQARIEAMAKRLANLEDFVSDEQAGDLPLDAESIELMLGIDASMIEVVADGGSKPSAAMLGWAQELQPGNWFTLDHNGKTNQVQYAWCSDRKQLHLFASTDGRSFLIQVRRLAAYLQAGLLVPAEEEALTVRATRDALAKLDANPERLLES
jgi:hypothetical protein